MWGHTSAAKKKKELHQTRGSKYWGALWRITDFIWGAIFLHPSTEFHCKTVTCQSCVSLAISMAIPASVGYYSSSLHSKRYLEEVSSIRNHGGDDYWLIIIKTVSSTCSAALVASQSSLLAFWCASSLEVIPFWKAASPTAYLWLMGHRQQVKKMIDEKKKKKFYFENRINV